MNFFIAGKQEWHEERVGYKCKRYWCHLGARERGLAEIDEMGVSYEDSGGIPK